MAPVAGLNTTSLVEVFVESSGNEVSEYVPPAISTVCPGPARR